jgi:signal transduction histidine kinase
VSAACAEHLLSLVSDILDFERIESNQLQLERIPFSIVEEAQKAVHLLQITAGTTHSSLTQAQTQESRLNMLSALPCAAQIRRTSISRCRRRSRTDFTSAIRFGTSCSSLELRVKTTSDLALSRNRFRQVLFNLLSNAIKFTPDSGSVCVRLYNDEDTPEEVVASVTDTGIGIKQDSLKQLFAVRIVLASVFLVTCG